MNPKAVTVLVILAAAGIAAAIYATRSGPAASDGTPSIVTGVPVFPDLTTKAGEVSEITIKHVPLEFAIKKDGDQWKIPDKANYPAKLDTVRALVVAMSQFRIEEEKTSRPDQYSKLGVDDPVAPPPDAADKAVPQSILVTLKNASGAPVASVILGNPKYDGPGIGGTSSPRLYVRKPGDKQSWLVSGQVEVPKEPLGWLETKFADVKRERIRSLTITHPDGSRVAVSRDIQAAPFAVKDIPAGRELKDPGVGESLATALTGLTFQDVASANPPAPAAGAPVPEAKPGPTIELRTFDGLIVTATSVTKEAKAWWTLVATADESLAAPTPPTPAPEKPAAEPVTGDKPAETPPAPPAVATVEALRKEVTELNAEWAPYSFAPVDWKVRSINSTLNDLLKEPTPPAAPPPAAVQPSPALPTLPGSQP